MPSNKILTTIVICLGLIVSVWLIQKVPAGTVKNTAINSVTSAKNTINDDNYDWKSTLETISKSDQKVLDVTKNSNNEFDDSTLTAQIAKDFFSQYLLAKKGGVDITAIEVQQIASNVLSNQQYIVSRGVLYNENNLKIVNSSDSRTMLAYKSAMVTSIRKGFESLKRDPSGIVVVAINTKDASRLSGLDPIISANKVIISDFLSIQVPKGAVSVHLTLLNALSNTLEDLESMRSLFDDPLKGFGAIKFYDTHTTEFINSLNSMSAYLVKIK
jgi:hypothetical protein